MSHTRKRLKRTRSCFIVRRDYIAGLTDGAYDFAVYPKDADPHDTPPMAVFKRKRDAANYARQLGKVIKR